MSVLDARPSMAQTGAFDFTSPQAWVRAWGEAISGPSPAPQRRLIETAPFPHRKLPGLVLVTARFG
ncbi:MAG: hypothetical protein V4737_10670, partial [Curtobacterium sp.]